MSKKTQREVKKVQWREIAKVWKKFLPPAKPSKKDITFYEKYLKKLIKERNGEVKALILGSTPEFRDLLSKYKIETIFVDINSHMVKAMTSLLKLPKNKKEKMVLSDWLKMPFEKDSFDLVLSDSAQDNIKFSEFKTFFKKVHKALKPGGYWFFGAVNVNPKDTLTFDQYINLYKKFPAIFKDQRSYLLNVFRISYNKDFYNQKNRQYDFNKVDKKIDQLIKQNKLPSKAKKVIGLNMDYQQVVISKKDFKNLLSNNFSIINEFQDKSHPAMKIKWTAVLQAKK